MLGERLPEQQTGAMQAGLHGFRAKPEELGGLVYAHVFEDAGYKDGTKLVREFINGLFDKMAEFALDHGALRIKLTAGKGNDVRIARMHRLRDIRLAPTLPKALHRCIEHDAVQPGCET